MYLLQALAELGRQSVELRGQESYVLDQELETQSAYVSLVPWTVNEAAQRQCYLLYTKSMQIGRTSQRGGGVMELLYRDSCTNGT